MPLTEATKDELFLQAMQIQEKVDYMVDLIAKEDPRLADNSRAYWAAHIKSALSTSYGGLGNLLGDR